MTLLYAIAAVAGLCVLLPLGGWFLLEWRFEKRLARWEAEDAARREEEARREHQWTLERY